MAINGTPIPVFIPLGSNLFLYAGHLPPSRGTGVFIPNTHRDRVFHGNMQRIGGANAGAGRGTCTGTGTGTGTDRHEIEEEEEYQTTTTTKTLQFIAIVVSEILRFSPFSTHPIYLESQRRRSLLSQSSHLLRKMGLWTILEGFLLLANALAILNEDRFLAPRGWSFAEFSAGRTKSFKGQLIGLIYATQYMRFRVDAVLESMKWDLELRNSHKVVKDKSSQFQN
ncbi:hypothetical protein GQ457_05G020010 [Hibiscus cannabinus]